MASNKFIKCKFCSKLLQDEEKYANHIELKHPDMIIPGMVPRQFVYYLRTGKTHGNCVMCKEPTKWNPNTNKYNRFCENPKCKEEYREQFKKRMLDKYGKITLCNDPEMQRKMLAARRISGEYRWSTDPRYKVQYTGTYELDFLIFLDRIMRYEPGDIMMPSPHTYFYIYEGKKHFYIPDCYIPSLNLEIEIKDGGSNPNNHPKIQQVDKVKERLKDEIFLSKDIPFNYLKIVNKDYMIFFRYLELAKKQELAGITKKIVMKD